MLTINADAHPLIRRFHKPGDEKRSVVVVPPAHYREWLYASPRHARDLLQPFPAGEFVARASPRPGPGTPKGRDSNAGGQT
jgi:putative SOS response-associated peptidase YedK